MLCHKLHTLLILLNMYMRISESHALKIDANLMSNVIHNINKILMLLKNKNKKPRINWQCHVNKT